MTITYALMSVLFGGLCAALAWMEAGLLWAAITYVTAGSIALLATAFHVSGARLRDDGILDGKAVTPGRNSARVESVTN